MTPSGPSALSAVGRCEACARRTARYQGGKGLGAHQRVYLWQIIDTKIVRRVHAVSTRWTCTSGQNILPRASDWRRVASSASGRRHRTVLAAGVISRAALCIRTAILVISERAICQVDRSATAPPVPRPRFPTASRPMIERSSICISHQPAAAACPHRSDLGAGRQMSPCRRTDGSFDLTLSTFQSHRDLSPNVVPSSVIDGVPDAIHIS